MGRRAQCIVAFILVVTLFPSTGRAAEPTAGQREYETGCAMCHGLKGRGDGWLSQHLLDRVPPLTQLKKRNGGVFPFEYAYEVIDGRKDVRLHGPRGMPVWGVIYGEQADFAFQSSVWRYHVHEAFVRARVLALIEHLSRLQE